MARGHGPAGPAQHQLHLRRRGREHRLCLQRSVPRPETRRRLEGRAARRPVGPDLDPLPAVRPGPADLESQVRLRVQLQQHPFPGHGTRGRAEAGRLPGQHGHSDQHDQPGLSRPGDLRRRPEDQRRGVPPLQVRHRLQRALGRGQGRDPGAGPRSERRRRHRRRPGAVAHLGPADECRQPRARPGHRRGRADRPGLGGQETRPRHTRAAGEGHGRPEDPLRPDRPHLGPGQPHRPRQREPAHRRRTGHLPGRLRRAPEGRHAEGRGRRHLHHVRDVG